MNMIWLEAIRFKEVNNVASGSCCRDLPTLKDNRSFTSCWKVPILKRIKLLFTGKIWLCLEHKRQPKEMKDIFGGLNYHQPTSMTIDYPFTKGEEYGKRIKKNH